MTAIAHAPVTAAPRRERFGHQPALDGLRGLSVLMVLCFHGGWSWMSGGYVGVSVFFTLSGFLITRLLLDERDRRGRVNVVRFWGRRMRRLLPAGLACLVGVGVLATLGAFGDQPGLRGALLASLLHVANWHSLAGGVSYAQQVLGQRSPLDHYWSLAIEEQFYWVWPVVMVAAMRRRRPDRIVVGLTALAFAAAPLMARWFGADAAYWATPARAAEILAGASLAVVLHRRSKRPPAWVAWLGPPSLTAIVAIAVVWPSSGGPAYAGWLPAFALLSTVLVLSLQVRSPMRRLMSWRPLAGLGVVSYGVYLYHWPIFVLLDRRLAGLTHTQRFLAELAVTVVVAGASYRWIERPVRRGAVRGPQLVRPIAVGCVAVLALVGVGSFGTPGRFDDPASAPDQLRPVSSLVPLVPTTVASETPMLPPVSTTLPARVNPDLPGASPAAAPSTTVVATAEPVAVTTPADAAAVGADVDVLATPARPVRVLVVGDSTAWSTGDGLAAWAAEHPDLASVTLTVSPGCGFVQGGRVPGDDGAGYVEMCRTALSDRMNQALRDLRPDVVMLMATRTDVKDRQWSSGEGVLTIGDARFQERMRADYSAITQWILGSGAAHVVWIEPPAVRPDPAPADETTDPERMAVLHRIIREAVADADPARVTSVDLAAWYGASGIDDSTGRLDGMHFELPAATDVAERFLGPVLVNTALGS